jgi:hypothetical protein
MAFRKQRLRALGATPGGVAIALLALECLLCLSRWLRLPPFGHDGGAVVLAAFACLAAVAAIMLLWLALRLFARVRFQFSIVAMFCLSLAAALPFSLLATEIARARDERQVAEAIRRLGGKVGWRREGEESLAAVLGDSAQASWIRIKSRSEAWAGALVGVDFADCVTFVEFPDEGLPARELPDARATETALGYLDRLRGVHGLALWSRSVTDSGLKHVERLGKLQFLTLDGTQVTDRGMDHLMGLTRLRSIDLSDTSVSDDGIRRLGCLSRVETLCLRRTKVTGLGLARFARLKFLWLAGSEATDTGLADLEPLTQLCILSLDGTHVGDAGVAHLEHLGQVSWLNLFGTNVTDAGLEHLERLTRLRRLDLGMTNVTDCGVRRLKRLSRLRSLELFGSKVTNAGIGSLQRALPNCKITTAAPAYGDVSISGKIWRGAWVSH